MLLPRGFFFIAICVPNYNRINEWPLQFLRTGHYYRSYGYLYGRTANGDWWSSTASSAAHGRFLGAWTGIVHAQISTFRGYGFALRGVGKYLNLYSMYKLGL